MKPKTKHNRILGSYDYVLLGVPMVGIVIGIALAAYLFVVAPVTTFLVVVGIPGVFVVLYALGRVRVWLWGVPDSWP